MGLTGFGLAGRTPPRRFFLQAGELLRRKIGMEKEISRPVT